jgi:diguanylate cyclase (GGDEF)-like protein
MAHSEIERLANIDTLTGISSRFRFLNRLHSQTRRAGASCALFCVDLDRFKEVNDTLGHAAGDAVLKCVAQALLAITGNGESVARLGGDEFAVLMSGSQGGADAEIVAARIVAALSEPIPFDGHKIVIGASVGVAMFPGHASDAESLLHNADLALYEVKSSGRNGYRLYDSEMNIRIQQRKDIVRELRTAAATDALEVHYQPVVNSDSGRTVGFEALMRWNRPAMGPIPPGIFIPIAEEAGLMTQLGAWVISRACEDLALLPPGIRMGINVSANQFRSPDLFAHIKDTIARTGIDPTRLVFEITESVLVSNADVARGLLENLRGVGAQIALDDFGTGYSALGYLQQFPITVVKIDQSFIAGMLDQKANQAVIRAIMGIGRDLDIDVVAEGVETIGQVEALQGYGCRFMQGYFFGKARPLTDVITDLAISKLNDDPPKPHPERAYAIKLS